MRSPWLSRRFVPAALVALLISHSVYAQQEKAPPAPADKSPEATPGEKPAADPFKVPEGNDTKVLQGFLAGLAKAQPAKGSLPGRREHYRKAENALKQVEQKDLDEQTALITADLRFQVLQILEQFGDENAAADRAKFADSLTKHKHPKVRDLGLTYALVGRILTIGEMKTDARQKLIDDVAAFLRQGELTEERILMAQEVGKALANVGDNELASKALESFAAAFETRKEDGVGGLAERLRGTGRRYGLVGKPMEVKGKTVQGKDFNLESLKGKVVLVDFWATWCGPCMAEMPHIRELYEGYNKKGFEVVGISLDHKREVLESFLTAEKVPWVQLYADATDGDSGWENPIAKHYGISAIPSAILVGKDGNVISLNAIGRDLTRLLEKELGAPEEKKPAEGDKEAPKNN